MPKYLSGRVKKTPSNKLDIDRYKYLDLGQSEPDPGYPGLHIGIANNAIGPAVPGESSLPPGTQYQLVTVWGDDTATRYWRPIGGGMIPGSISVYEEGSIVGTADSVTQLNFLGNSIQAESVLLGVAATITVSPPGDVGSVLFKENVEYQKWTGSSYVTAYRDDFNTSYKLQFDSTAGILTATSLNIGTAIAGVGGSIFNVTGLGNTALVGIGTTNPLYNLHVFGDVGISSGTIYDVNNFGGNDGDIILKNSDGYIEWKPRSSVITSAGGTIGNIQFHASGGYVDGASDWDGSSQDASNAFVWDSTNHRVGIGSTLPSAKFDVTGNSKFTGITTFAGITTVTSDTLFTKQLSVSGFSTFVGVSSFKDTVYLNDIKISSNTIESIVGNLIIDSNGGTTQIDDNVYINITTESNLTSNGALTVGGGVGIDKNLNVGGASSLAGYTTSENTFEYKFITGTEPTAEQVYFDQGNYTTTNQIKIHKTDDDSGDRSTLLASLRVGDRIKIINESDTTKTITYKITGNPTVGGSGADTGHVYVIPISYLSGTWTTVSNLHEIDVTITQKGEGSVTLASSGGITTTGGDLYVKGDLYTNNDIVSDEGLFQRLVVNSGVATFHGNVYALSNVGINTTAPSAKLQIDYDEGDSEVGLRLRAYNAANSKTWQISEINGDAGILQIRNQTDEKTIISIDGINERVGIGTIAPQQMLDVRGNALIGLEYISGAGAGLNAPGITTIRGHHVNSEGDFARLYFANSKSATGSTGFTTEATASIRGVRDSQNYGTALSFYTNNTAVSASNPHGEGSERLRINSSGITTFYNDITLEAGGANRISIRHTSGGNAVIKNPTPASLSFGTQNNDNELTILNGGNVGIGSSNPQTKLDVVSTSVSRTWTPVSSAVAMFERNGVSRIGIVGTTKCQIDFGDSDDDNPGYIRYDHSDNSMLFRVNAKERLRIDSSGNVGIGTTNPDELLHLYHATKPFIRLETATDSEKRLDLYVGTSGIGTIAANQSSSQLSFRTTDGEALRIDQNGNVGIGTINPTGTAALTGNTAILAVGTLKANNIEGTYTVPGETGNLFFNKDDDLTAASTLYWNETDNKLGIGTTNPDETLEFFKASGTNLVKVSTEANSTIGIEIEKTGATTQSWRIVDGQTLNGKLEFYDVTDSATRMIIDGDGNIGIGTDTPDVKLDVVGSIRSVVGGYVDDNYAATFTAREAQEHSFELTVNQNSSTAEEILGTYYNKGGSHSTNINAENGWRVGIGTTNPETNVHIKTPNTDVLRLESTESGADGANLIIRHTSSSPSDNDIVGTIQFDGLDDAGTPNSTTYAKIKGIAREVSSGAEKGDLVFETRKDATTFSEKLRIKSDGNVGIGTDQPASARLHLHDNTACRLQLTTDNTGHGTDDGVRLQIDTSDNFEILQREDANIEFFTHNKQRVTIDGDGNVGIGTTNPSKAISSENNNTGITTLAVAGIVTAAKFYGDLVGGISNTGNVTITGNLSVNGNTTLGSENTDIITLTGIVTEGTVFQGTGGNDGLGHSPLVLMKNTSSESFNHSLQILAPNLTAAETNLLLIGKESDDRNSAYIGYRWYGDEDTRNILTFGHYGYNYHMNLDGNGNLGIGVTNPSVFDDEANDLVVGGGSGDTGITIYCGQNAGDHGSIFFADGITSDDLSRGQIRYEQNTEKFTFVTNGATRLSIDINGHTYPGASTQTLGSSSNRWGTIYATSLNITGGTSTIDNYIVEDLQVTGVGTFKSHVPLYLGDDNDLQIITTGGEPYIMGSNGDLNILTNLTTYDSDSVPTQWNYTYYQPDDDSGPGNAVSANTNRVQPYCGLDPKQAIGTWDAASLTHLRISNSLGERKAIIRSLSTISDVKIIDDTSGDYAQFHVTGKVIVESADVYLIPVSFKERSPEDGGNIPTGWTSASGCGVSITETSNGRYFNVTSRNIDINYKGIDFKGKVLAASVDGGWTGNNIDHIWHGDSSASSYYDFGNSGGVWNFCSDQSYKAEGTGTIRAGSAIFVNNDKDGFVGVGTTAVNAPITGTTSKLAVAGIVTAYEYYGTFKGTIDSGGDTGGTVNQANKIKTTKKDDLSTGYLTFVDSNNDPGAYETVYTATGIKVDSSTDTITATTFKGSLDGSATGSISGNVDGSVGSVTGSVGSVTLNVGGSVGSVTGSVGSVSGAVGSVSGAVGSVSGSVGSVSGSVGSVTGDVGGNATTASDLASGETDNFPKVVIQTAENTTGFLDRSGTGNYILATNSTSDGFEWVEKPSSGIAAVTVKQYSGGITERTCGNPISVTGGNAIGIAATSNAYGTRYIQDQDPATTHAVCDGDIWYDTSS